ncbi:MAG: N-acetyl-gamma-glutamyl-phosphate reductase [Micrococcales bacterium]
MAYTVAVAGASGNAGGELLRLIARHPELQLKTVTGSSMVGQRVSDVHPAATDFAHLVFEPTEAEILAGHDIVFLALPHAMSAALAKQLPADILVIDCAADFRLESQADWVKFYGGEHAGTWAYGMPELLTAGGKSKQRAELVGVKRIAVPGCNVTAITLGLAPALAAGLVEVDDLVSVLTVGTSGAGRGATEKLFELEPTGSANAYQVGGIHRHTPEIEQNLSKSADQRIQISFTPVLSSLERGILSVNTAKLAAGATLEQLREAFTDAYDEEFFVEVLEPGQFPSTADTIGLNKASIGIAIDEHAGRLVSICAIDNLVKGTAGAAIQSMNIALGLQEQTGLTEIGLN